MIREQGPARRGHQGGEKAYREWAHDIGPDDTPIEAGLAFTCAGDKPSGFIGREALLAKRSAGLPKRRLVQFMLEDPQPLLHHTEPIERDGVPCGITTSGMYGHTLGAAVALGYVHHAEGASVDYIAARRFVINVGRHAMCAIASLRPLHDSTGVRISG